MRTIEARAVISAKDATGNVFSAIAAKIRGLSSAAESASRRATSANLRAGAVEKAASTGSAARSAARSVAGVGAGVMGLPGLGVAGAAYTGIKAVKRFAEVDMSMMRIGVTADATDKQVGELEQTIRKTAFETGQSFDQVTKGMASLVAGGFDLEKALPALPAIAKTAQAAGAEVEDMATTTLALNQALGISTDKMQTSFDALVTAGKAGKFELKDMARYLPSILPAVSALGLKGQEGLEKVAALMQTVRAGTGTTEEAAQSLINIFQKMESEETVNKFKKVAGIDLRKKMDEARKGGKDLLETFKEVTQQALKGDMSKLPQLFSDQQMNRGMTAWLTFGDVFDDVMQRMKKSAGSGDVDLKRMLERPQVALNRLSESYDRATTALGAYLDKLGASKALNWVAEDLEKTAQNGPVFPWQLGAENDLNAPELAAARKKLQDEEAKARGSKLTPYGMKGPEPTAAEIEKGMQSPAIRALRQQVFDLEQRSGVQKSAPGPESMFGPNEIKAWQDAEDRRKGDEEFLRIGREGRKQKGRVTAQGSMKWDGGHRVSDGSAGEFNILDLPYQGGGDPDRRAAAAQPVTVNGEMKGDATIKVVIEAPQVIQAVADAKAVTAEMRGLLKSGNGPGSTGKSSPDTGASGGW